MEASGDSDDEALLERLRIARKQELVAERSRNRYGTVPMLDREDFVREVTQSSKEGGVNATPQHVVLELVKPGAEASSATMACVNRVAEANPDVKFVRMVSHHCIENWPDSRVPAVFVYFNGQLASQLIGFAECGAGDDDALHASLRALRVPLRNASMGGRRVQQGRTRGKGEDEDEDEDFHGVSKTANRLAQRGIGSATKSAALSRRRDDEDDDE